MLPQYTSAFPHLTNPILNDKFPQIISQRKVQNVVLGGNILGSQNKCGNIGWSGGQVQNIPNRGGTASQTTPQIGQYFPLCPSDIPSILSQIGKFNCPLQYSQSIQTPSRLRSLNVNGAKYIHIKECKYRLFDGKLINDKAADKIYQELLLSKKTSSKIWRKDEVRLLQYNVFAIVLQRDIQVDQFSPQLWDCVASLVPLRTGAECQQKWIKTQKSARLQWTKVEDDILTEIVQNKFLLVELGENIDRLLMWRLITNEMNQVLQYKWNLTVKKCKERWTNVLDPNLQTSTINSQEEILLLDNYLVLENQWTTIAHAMHRSSNWAKNNIRKILKDNGIQYTYSFRNTEERCEYFLNVSRVRTELGENIAPNMINPTQIMSMNNLLQRLREEDGEEVKEKEGMMDYLDNRLFEVIRPPKDEKEEDSRQITPILPLHNPKYT